MFSADTCSKLIDLLPLFRRKWLVFKLCFFLKLYQPFIPNDLGGPVGNRDFWVGEDEIVMYANKQT